MIEKSLCINEKPDVFGITGIASYDEKIFFHTLMRDPIEYQKDQSLNRSQWDTGDVRHDLRPPTSDIQIASEVASAEEALLLVQITSFDVALLDIGLPDIRRGLATS